mmetsp:Transcript_7634/g.11103  ORF Transcript_7634/g.11103 Transcript_7634/m.11103 type:complete len:324 (-) Transcript_7634:97-1068(-)|eukprot:CAMPEP_0194238950 /NCGR_PEP_ID=MMETSP0158-20130606/5557_1 /TAXON_ID=33649 /ORGANISM="Thalassionema nitzschioides, Strain L26-B" /LENGTH=323 /DNA_ID=CAMNT_0038973317 /DNA_START=87 /DNA_END=1058 /DNA_ORIENTATION=-
MASTSDHENPLLTGIEKKELANLLSNMPDKPTPFLSLSSDLSAHAVSETLPSAQRVPETPDDGCPSLLRSPTGVCDLGALQEDNDFFHIPDNLLLGETEKDDFELTKEISFPLSKSRLVNNMYIENKCALVNSMIVNFSETINLMKDMREQSQKIQQQLHDLGDKVNIPHLEPAPELEIKEDEEGICTWPQIAPSPPPPNYRVIQKQTKSRRDCSGKQKFPSILHRLLLDLESMDDGSSIARFSPDGKAFVITDSVKFEKRVLSKYFPRMKNFSSFHRQLNLYDFERLSSHAKHAYYHALFRRDQPVCAALMRPTRIKGAFSK